jgi:hypothetical protein
LEKQTAKKQKKPLMRLFSIGRWYMIDQAMFMYFWLVIGTLLAHFIRTACMLNVEIVGK